MIKHSALKVVDLFPKNWRNRFRNEVITKRQKDSRITC